MSVSPPGAGCSCEGSSLDAAAAALRRHDLVLCPAEGVYGISCLADAEDALLRLLRLKGRESAKGFICVADSLERLDGLVDFKAVPDSGFTLLRRFWPGPYTFLLPALPSVSSLLKGQHAKIAVRISAFAVLRELCQLADGVLVSTSANLSGRPPSSQLHDVAGIIRAGCSYVLNLPCGGLQQPTAIYDLVTSTLIRPGLNGAEEFS